MSSVFLSSVDLPISFTGRYRELFTIVNQVYVGAKLLLFLRLALGISLPGVAAVALRCTIEVIKDTIRDNSGAIWMGSRVIGCPIWTCHWIVRGLTQSQKR